MKADSIPEDARNAVLALCKSMTRRRRAITDAFPDHKAGIHEWFMADALAVADANGVDVQALIAAMREGQAS